MSGEFAGGGTRWFAVQTKPNQEDKAAFNLSRQGFGVYLPKYARTRRHARKVERVARPLFCGYLFVSLDTARQGWRSINSTLGVARLVSGGEAPSGVPETVIAALRAREGEDGCVRLEPRSRLAKGDAVQVVEGAFESCLGLYEGLDERARALILIDFLGRKVQVKVDLEVLAAA